MELELKKERYECYRPGAPLLMSFEETGETIVPDYCPDIARIIDVRACLLQRGYSLAEGRLTVSGSIRLTLLYLSEDTQGLQSLEYTLPFEHTPDDKFPDGCENASVEGRVCGAEARLLNPRKLFTRLDIIWRVTPYCREEVIACGEIVEQSAYAIQTLCGRLDASLILSVSEKDFVFSDELTISGGREPIRELLSTKVALRVTESKSVGSKVVVKGIACLSLLYTTESGELCNYAEELPFSQLLDGVAEGEGESSVATVLNLSGCEIHTVGESGGTRTIGIKLSLHAFVTVRCEQTVCCITDLYSTSYDLEPELARIELYQKPRFTTVTQSVREQLDTGTEVRSVLNADVCFGSVEIRQNGSAALRAAATVTALYLDDAGVPMKVERRIEISAETEVSDNVRAMIDEVCAGDITASINANGVELRFPAEFRITCMETLSCDCLTSLHASLPESGETDVPALVLRALDEGQSLWDVAKRYRTTVEEIISANELAENAALEAGRLLLIPRKR